MQSGFRKGDRVRVVRIPADVANKCPEESRAAFRLALGNTFSVQGANEIRWLELDLGVESDEVLGSTGNTIWIEPDCVEAVSRADSRGPGEMRESD